MSEAIIIDEHGNGKVRLVLDVPVEHEIFINDQGIMGKNTFSGEIKLEKLENKE